MRITRITIPMLLFFILSGSLHAQKVINEIHPLSKSILFSVGVGSNYSFTDYEDSELGTIFGGSLEYFLPTENKNIYGVKLSAAKQYFKGSKNNLGFKGQSNKFNTETSDIGFAFTYSYAVSNTFLPFISLGASYYWLAYDTEDVKSSFLPITNGSEKSAIVLDIVGSLKYLINEKFSANVSVGYHYTKDDNFDALAYGDYEDFAFSGQIGISYSIWDSKDSDDDGIPDKDDKCPFEFEDFDGFQDEDGCPDPDNDGDGILDSKDLCVNVAEDLDGFQDEDGCPDPDNDGDGILDINDKCPNEKEDFDGFEDNDGCPESDNDNDGITDDKDGCPNKAETFNGFQDKDGCPDVLPEPVYIEPEPIKEIPKVTKTKIPKVNTSRAPREFVIQGETTFITNSAQIKSSSHANLNRISDELKKYRNVKWRIEGHVDKQSSGIEANRISREQANAILNYLVSRGVNTSNFQAIGLGDSSPIASNNSVYGKMKNRRIIIRKVN